MANNTSVVLTGHLDTVVSRIQRELGKIALTNADNVLRYVNIEDGQVKFYNSPDTTGDVVCSFALPEEIFLDQTQTTLVENFSWSESLYPNSTNPNLEGKIVLVLAVKGDNTLNPTLKYSFVNLERLIDQYFPGDKSINIAGFSIAVNLSKLANNALTLQSDGLHVDISGKVDKVSNAGLSNIVIFGASGAILDSGVTFASDSDVSSMLNEIFGVEQQSGD